MKLMRRNTDLFPTFFDDIFGRDWLGLENRPVNSVPAVNISENEKSYLVEIAAPGMKKSDFNIEVDNDSLTISYERKEEKTENNEGYTRKEFEYNSFSRSFVLPDTANAEKIEAKYKDGLLQLTIPKREEAIKKAPRLINIS